MAPNSAPGDNYANASMNLEREPKTPQDAIVPRRRWGIALLLGFGVLVNYFDRVNLSVSQDALRAAFGISPVMFGYLSTFNYPQAPLRW